MASITCQTCNMPNPDTLEICQYCGTPLKNRGTEPLPTIRPGEVPVKQQTSELESTLPSWLREMRKGDGPDAASSAPKASSEPSSSKPTIPQRKDVAPSDFLAGLSNLSDDDDDAEPDWLSNIKGSMPPVSSSAQPAASAPEDESVDWLGGLTGASSTSAQLPDQPVDWLAGFQEPTSPQTAQPSQPSAMDWGFDDQADEPAQPAAQEETPDWLSALKAQDTSLNTPAQPKAPDFSSESEPSMGDFPDWLSGLGGESAPGAGIQQTPTSSVFDDDTSADSGGLHDWLSGMPESPASPVTPTPAAPIEDSASGLGDFSDWLNNLGGDKAPEPQIPGSSTPTQNADVFGDSPDWLSSLGSDSASTASTAAPSSAAPVADDSESMGDFPDWLNNLGGEKSPEPQIPASPTPTQNANVFDDSPDWLSSLGGESTPSASTVAPSSAVPVADDAGDMGDFPDWLSNLGGDSTPAASAPAPTPTPAAPVAQDAGDMGDFPDWLSNLGSDSTPAASTPAPMSAAPVAQDSGDMGDFPDWLSNLGSEGTPAMQQPQASPASPVTPADSSAGADFPDWLSSGSAESGMPTPPAAEETSPAAGGASLFDGLMIDSNIGWLDTPSEEKEKPAAEPPKPSIPMQKAFRTGSLEGLSPPQSSDEVPDWLANLNATAPKKPQEPVGATDFPSDDAFDWLSADKGGATPSMTDAAPTGGFAPETAKPTPSIESSPSAFLTDSSQNLDSIFSMEMPDWLSGFTPSETPAPSNVTSTPTEQPPALTGDNLSPADLPSWVQAMRPIESVVGGTQGGLDDQVVEQEGPLAGFRSVLPTQASALGVRKPKSYAIKLQVDPTQMTQATLLENLIASEAESRPVVTAKQVVNIRGLRWIIAVILLLVTLVPGVIGLHFFPLPATSSEQATSFYTIVNNLPDDSAKVLVVFDYQPGYAGEMEHAAAPVMRHLINKNARLAFVSTLPTGVLMSDRIMDLVDPDTNPAPEIVEKYYKKGEHYIDLGYLPGDAAGIQVFAKNPKMLGNDWQDGKLWEDVEDLKQIGDSLANFDAAIVLTDNPDTGRMWIEQAGLALATKPMLMVVSAQAAPMIFPYAESGQVKGLVSGLVGGARYEQLIQQPKGRVSYYYWDSYGAGMIAAELVIVFGGLWALIQRLRTRRAEQNRDEDEE